MLKIRVLAVIIAFGILGCTASRTAKDFDIFYNKYEDNKGVTTLEIPVFLVRAFMGKKERQSATALSKLNKVKLFICNKNNNTYSRIISNYLPNRIYSDLMGIQTGKDKIVLKMRKPKQQVISEIVMTLRSPKSFVAIEFKGNFNIQDVKLIAKILKNKNIRNLW